MLSGEWLLPYHKQGGCARSPLFVQAVMPLLCALPLWCPGLVAAIHKRQFGTALLKKQGYGVMGKTCDLVAGSYRFSEAWGNPSPNPNLNP